MDDRMTIGPVETDAQADLRVRSVRAGAALQLAPELVAHIRARSHPTDGRTERGIEIAQERTPLLTGFVDDADEVYALLHGWVDMFRGKAPGVAWRRVDRHGVSTAIGLPARISDRGAEAMTFVLATWLRQRALMIQDHPAALDFYDEVTTTIWAMRAAHQLTSARALEVHPRPCPVCGEVQVRVEFFGQSFEAAERRGEFDPIGAGTADERRDPSTRAGKAILDAVSGVDVRCAHCGWTAVPRVSEVIGWLT
jgi:hypothetical protein